MSDILERLESLADCDARAGEPLGRCMREAAAEIRRLFAERVELAAERERYHTEAVRRAKEISRLTAERDALREALQDIGIYGCGMLNQPAALNAPEGVWLRKRIEQYERVARAAIEKGDG